MKAIFRIASLLTLVLCLNSCSRCCRHCPTGEIQKISHIPKDEFYKNHYQPTTTGKRAMG